MGFLSEIEILYKFWNTWQDKKLTVIEKEILINANNNNGEIVIHNADQTGEFVSINKINYFDENDPAIRASALEAMEKLFRRGLIRYEGGILFCLTGTGFEVARNPKKQK